MNEVLKKPAPPPLPKTTEQLLSQRVVKFQRTLNDMVEDIHIKLWEDPKYVAFLRAVYDEQAIEGSLSADNIMAAMVIRDDAKKTGNVELAHEKLATISKSLGVVLRRYDISRKDRRQMVGGEKIDDNNGE